MECERCVKGVYCADGYLLLCQELGGDCAASYSHACSTASVGAEIRVETRCTVFQTPRPCRALSRQDSTPP